MKLWRIHPKPVEALALDLPLTLGRHEENRLRFQEDDVSRFHARVERRGDSLMLLDMGSRNGTYLNAHRVGVGALLPGSVIRVGQTVLWLGSARASGDLIREAAEAAARSNDPVLIIGEPGVGKRSLARRIHRLSGRAGPFVVCERVIDEPIAKAASGGTIVVEEPEDFDASIALASGHGARLVALSAFARTNQAIRIEVPPLRERLNELPDALAQFGSAAGAAAFDWAADVIEALACHPFPLNFSGLEVLARQLAQNGAFVTLDHLPDSIRGRFREARQAFVRDLTREQLVDALARHKGNVRRISQEFGLHRVQLYRLFAALGLDPDAYRTGETPPGEERRTIA